VPQPGDDVVLGTLPVAPPIAIADLLANDIDPGGGSLTLHDVDEQTVRGLNIVRSGAWLLLGDLPPGTRSDAFTYTVANEAGRTASAQVVVRLTPIVVGTSSLVSITREANGIRIRFAGIVGHTYRLEFSASLTPGGWTTQDSATVDSTGYAEFFAPVTGVGGFFRTASP
jgi:hypothetical protein